MKSLTILVAVLSIVSLPVIAQEADSGNSLADSANSLVSDEQTQAVTKAISVFNCTALAVEKASATIFEVDDAFCGDAGQFDIQLDSDYKILSMTRD